MTSKKTARRSCTDKVAVAAGSLAALGAMATTADAVPIEVTGAPVTLGLGGGGPVAWDVDGAGGDDFRLHIAFGGSVFLASNGLNGRGLVAPFYTDNVQALAASFNVGPTLAGGVWGPGSYPYRNAMQPGPQIGYDFNYGFAPGDNYFGFRFIGADAGMHYGFGVINFDVINGIVSIVEWAYESLADTAIHVQDIDGAAPVPEPSSLALLALGAGGLAVLRRRRKNADAAKS